MRATLLLILAVLLPASPVLAQATERTVYASVVDKNDAPVKGLAASEFIVREDDTAREVLRVSAATAPMQIAVLVDTSQAMEEHMLDVRNALRAFFKQMGGKHDIALIGLGERPTVLSDYTRDAARLEKAVGSVFSRSGSGTYILDGIVETANGLQKRKADAPAHHRLRRRRSRVQRAVSRIRDRRTARVGRDAAYVDAQQTGRRHAQPGRAGACAGRSRRHEADRRPPRRSSDANGAGRPPAVAGERARESVPGRVCTPVAARSAEEPRGHREAPRRHSPRTAVTITNAPIATATPASASAA